MKEQFEGAKVIVTGGAGFIGSHLCEELVLLGAEVLSIDDYSAGKKSNVEFLEGYTNYSAIDKSVVETAGMDDIFEGVDFVFHNAASKKNICEQDPKRDLKVNAEGTLNLLQFALKHKVKHFVHASTGSVYGEPSVFPSDETHPLKPVSYYGVSKLAGERYVDIFNHLFGLNTTILRYFHVYGPRQESNQFGGVVSIFHRQALSGETLNVFGDGKQIRSFTWVKDLVEINLKSAITDVAIGKVYNAASGIQISINDLAEYVVDVTESKSPIIHGEPLLGDIHYFEVCNKLVCEDLDVAFEKDFWGTLRSALDLF